MTQLRIMCGAVLPYYRDHLSYELKFSLETTTAGMKVTLWLTKNADFYILSKRKIYISRLQYWYICDIILHDGVYKKILVNNILCSITYECRKPLKFCHWNVTEYVFTLEFCIFWRLVTCKILHVFVVIWHESC